MKLRATLENGTVIEGQHRNDIEAGLGGWEVPVIRLDFVSDDGEIVVKAVIPDDWREASHGQHRRSTV